VGKRNATRARVHTQLQFEVRMCKTGSRLLLLANPQCDLTQIIVGIVCAQATYMHLIHNWSDYMSYSYMKCDGYKLSRAHVSMLF
jgi:hypothetical protein